MNTLPSDCRKHIMEFLSPLDTICLRHTSKQFLLKEVKIEKKIIGPDILIHDSTSLVIYYHRYNIL